MKSKHLRYAALALFIIALDQSSKLFVHAYMELNEQINLIGDWATLRYVHNEGMAFGMKFDHPYGKLSLSLFRIIATVGIGVYIHSQIKRHAHAGYVTCLTMIFAGAVGNAIDSTFYGVLIDGNILQHDQVITPWFHGKVIDMLYFPMFDVQIPDWSPIYAGQKYRFFNAIFNLADSSIFLGVVALLVFHRRFLIDPNPQDIDAAEKAETGDTVVTQADMSAEEPDEDTQSPAQDEEGPASEEEDARRAS